MRIIILIAVLSLLMTGCPQSSSDMLIPTATPSQPTVTIDSPRVSNNRLVKTEPIWMENCDGNASTDALTRRFAWATSKKIDLGAELMVNAQGSVGLPMFGDVEVGTEAKSIFDHVHGEEISTSTTISFLAKPGMNMLHKVLYYESYYTGTLTVFDDVNLLGMPLEFRHDVFINTSSVDTGCPPPKYGLSHLS